MYIKGLYRKSRKLCVRLSLSCFICLFIICMSSAAVFAFSDEYEVYYPQPSAEYLTTDQIYDRTLSNGTSLSPEVEAARKEVIDMYKSVGIDVSLDIDNWLDSKVLIDAMPQTWSKDTPKPLSGNYDQPFSIDAPWNNPIPRNNPRVKLSEAAFQRSFQLSGINSKNTPGGDGLGIPIVISGQNDPIQSIVESYPNDDITMGAKMHIRSDAEDFRTLNTSGDQHMVFIDDTDKTMVHAWQIRTPLDGRGITGKGTESGGLNSVGIRYGYDYRGLATSKKVRLDGIGSEGRVSTTGTNIPIISVTLRNGETIDPNNPITHAIGGAGFPLMKARVYPATSVDYFIANSSQSVQGNVGAVPYGGIVQMDPNIDLDALYAAKKLSLPAYRILQAWQNYGYYLIDASGSTSGPSFLQYSSNNAGEWKDSSRTDLNVPYDNNNQGVSSIQKEINAFMNGDSFFGIGKPDFYVTAPVMKYTELDVNSDGKTDLLDLASVARKVGENYDATAAEDVVNDVNKDKVYDYKDVLAVSNYIMDKPQHVFDYCSLSVEDSAYGHIAVSYDAGIDKNQRSFKKNTPITVTADPLPGYRFVRWTGALEGVTNNIADLIMDADKTIGAVYEATNQYTLSASVENQSEGTISVSGYFGNADVTNGSIQVGENATIMVTANPAPGYAFDSWSGDYTGPDRVINFFINRNLQLEANFSRALYSQNFSTSTLPDGWILSDASKPYSISGGKLLIGAWNDWGGPYYATYSGVHFGNNYKYKVDVTTGAGADGNKARILFNYIDNNNFYYFNIGSGSSATVELRKKFGGTDSLISRYTGTYTLDNTTTTFQVIYEPGGYISLTGTRKGTTTKFFDRVHDTSLTGGGIGVGRNSNAFAYFSNISVIQPTLNTDARLSDLQVGGTTVTGFTADTLNYDVVLPAGTTTVPTVTATVYDTGKATVVVTPAASLPGTTTVLVTAQDGTTTRTYTVNFKVASYAQNFTGSTLPTGWVLGGSTQTTDYIVQSGRLRIGNFSYACFTAYNGITLGDSFSYKVDVTSGAGSDGNKARILFNYINSLNYYYINIGSGTSSTVELRKKIGGVDTLISTYSGKYALDNTTTTFQITREAGGYISLTGTRNSITTKLFDRVQDTALSGGGIGVGSIYNLYAYFTNIIIY